MDSSVGEDGRSHPGDCNYDVEYFELSQMMYFLEKLIKINGTAVTNFSPAPDLRSTHVMINNRW